MTPKRLLEAIDRFGIINGMSGSIPIKWLVFDRSSEEPDVDWPGKTISEHDSRDEARLGWAAAVIKQIKDMDSI